MDIVDDLIPDDWKEGVSYHFHSANEAEITKDIVIKHNSYKATQSSFTNILFRGIIEIEGFELKEGLEFSNCKFKKGVTIANFQHGAQFSGDIRFVNCVFEHVVRLVGERDHSSFGCMEFDNCQFERSLSIKKIKGELVQIIRCVFKNVLRFEHIQAVSQLHFFGNSIQILELRAIFDSKINFEGDNTINHFFKLHQGQNSSFVFEDISFNSEVELNLSEKMKECTISIIKCIFRKDVAISSGITVAAPNNSNVDLIISHNKFENGLVIRGLNDNQTGDFPYFKSAKFEFSNKSAGEIVLKEFNVGLLEFSGYNSYSNVTVKDVCISKLKIIDFTNISGFRLINIHTFTKEDVQSLIEIKQSQLGNALLSNINFKEFDVINLSDVMLSTINTSMINWFDPQNMNAQQLERLKSAKVSSYEVELGNYYQAQQEIYRQLKVAAQKEGNIAQSLSFQRNEMHFYRLTFRNHKLIRAAEYFILWSNQSNDFGQNWIKSAVLLLVCSFIAYIPIGFLISDKLNYDQWASSWNDVLRNIRVIFCDNIRYWFITLNPAHRINDIGKSGLTMPGWLYFWDMLSRIVVSYFLFQTVSAFRKLNK